MSDVDTRSAHTLVRRPERSELDRLARIWHDGWQDAHATILPEALKRLRTLASFRERIEAGMADTRVTGAIGAPLGLCSIKRDELYQLYVTPEARGTGVARALVADAEARIAEGGADRAWLACAIGNDRAARFYEKCGWHRAATVTIQLDTPNGPFPLEVWRYEKALGV